MGQALETSGYYEPLFSLIGTRHGGDGATTFALPDLRHVAPRSANGEPVHYVICIDGTFPSQY